MLTVYPVDPNGDSRWTLENFDQPDKAATLHDVTHLGCRSARYTPVNANEACSPASAPQSAFRVAPGVGWVVPGTAGGWCPAPRCCRVGGARHRGWVVPGTAMPRVGGARHRDATVPGTAMPPGAGCNKQDYAVLFVIGVAEQ